MFNVEHSQIKYCKSIDAISRGHRIKNYKDLDIALKKDDEILAINYKEMKKVVEFKEIKNKLYNLKSLLERGEKIYIDNFNVESREKEFGIFNIKVERIDVDLKSYIEKKSGLKIKNEFDLEVLKLTYDLGEEYRIIPFKIYKKLKINQEIFIDTHYIGIKIENDIRMEDIIEYKFDVYNYMELISLIREINYVESIYNDNPILCKRNILTPDKNKIKNPTVYKLNDESTLVEFIVEIRNDNKSYNYIRLERVKFEKNELNAVTVTDFNFKKIYKI